MLFVFFLRLRTNERTRCSVETAIAAEEKRWVGVLIEEAWRHHKGEKVTKNALKKLDGILLPEFYNKVAEVMQEEKTTLKSLQNSFDDMILEQWVSMHLDHPHNGQYVRPEKGVYHRRDVGSISASVRRTFSISVL